jgi:hypothetical protein
MLRARRLKQQEFRLGADFPGTAVEQYPPYLQSEGGAPWFGCCEDGYAATAEPLLGKPQLRRFAASLNSVEGDKFVHYYCRQPDRRCVIPKKEAGKDRDKQR